MALARLHMDPVDPRRYRADVPPSLATTVMRALRRDPAERFGDAAEFRAALLETAPPQPIAVAPVSPVTRNAPAEPVDAPGFGRSERRWLVPALGILMVAGALVVAGTLLRQNTGDPVIPPSTLPPPAEAPKIAAVSTYDPSGRGRPRRERLPRVGSSGRRCRDRMAHGELRHPNVLPPARTGSACWRIWTGPR
ncbi:MAG: hypothetical protein M5U19_01015 [Microthrixaceae bacterium]|nr:hypothetical protein [Microthrixaceae bacterium]